MLPIKWNADKFYLIKLIILIVQRRFVQIEHSEILKTIKNWGKYFYILCYAS